MATEAEAGMRESTITIFAPAAFAASRDAIVPGSGISTVLAPRMTTIFAWA